MEKPLFFKNNSHRIFGIIHSPTPINRENKSREPNKNDIGIILCAPFAEEKLSAHRVMVNLARRLMKEGMYCFRFDYWGHGDSEGNFEDSSIETRISDIRAAINYVKENTNVKEIVLLGVRFGSTLATLTAHDESSIDGLVLIAPILNGKNYIEQVLRSNLTTQMTTYKKIIKSRDVLIDEIMAGNHVNIDGYLLSKILFQQISQIDLPNKLRLSSKKILTIQVSNKEDKPIESNIKAFSAYVRATASNTVDMVNINENFFWKENKIYKPKVKNLENGIINWFEKVYSIKTV